MKDSIVAIAVGAGLLAGLVTINDCTSAYRESACYAQCQDDRCLQLCRSFYSSIPAPRAEVDCR